MATLRRALLAPLTVLLVAQCGGSQGVNTSSTTLTGAAVTVAIREIISDKDCKPGDEVGQGREALATSSDDRCVVVGRTVVDQNGFDCRMPDAGHGLTVRLNADGQSAFNRWVKEEHPQAGAVVVGRIVVSTPQVYGPSPDGVDLTGTPEEYLPVVNQLFAECSPDDRGKFPQLDH